MGLVLCQKALKKSAEGFFLWFWPPLRENRQEAKDEFDKLLQKLQNYLNELDVGWGSGVYAEKLRDIENYLAELPKSNIEPDALVRRISEFQRDPSKYDLIINIGRIRETAHHVRNAFSASRKP